MPNFERINLFIQFLIVYFFNSIQIMSAKVTLTKAQAATVQRALAAIAKPTTLAAKKSRKAAGAKKPAAKKATGKKGGKKGKK